MLISKQEEEAEDEASRRRQEAEDEGRTAEAAKGGRHQHLAILRRRTWKGLLGDLDYLLYM